MQAPIDPFSEQVTIVCSEDGRTFSVPVLALSSLSATINDLITDAGIGEPIIISEVKGDVFEKVVQYCMHHYASPNTETIGHVDDNAASQDVVPMEIEEKADMNEAIAAQEGEEDDQKGKEEDNGDDGASSEKKVKGEDEAPDLGPLRNFSDWDRQFVKMDDETIFYLLAAANKLAIKPLVDLIANAVAADIIGMTPKQIWNRYKNVGKQQGDASNGDEDEECPFTEAELEEVKKENTWMK